MDSAITEGSEVLSPALFPQREKSMKKVEAQLIRNMDGLSLSAKSTFVSQILYKLYTQTIDKQSRRLFTQWTQERLWGLVVKDHLPLFFEIWNLLKINGHTSKKRAFWYGDADGAIWVEKGKEQKKVLIVMDYATIADDNTHIFIADWCEPVDGVDEQTRKLLSSFKVRTVWPREHKSHFRISPHTENENDIDRPSLVTYRSRNWDFQDNVAGCSGYVINYKDVTDPRIEFADHYLGGIQYALYLLTFIRKELGYKYD